MFKVNNRNTQGVKYAIGVVLVSLLLNLYIFHTLFKGFYCYLCAGKCGLGRNVELGINGWMFNRQIVLQNIFFSTDFSHLQLLFNGTRGARN